MTEEEMKAFIGYDKLTKEDLWEVIKRGMISDDCGNTRFFGKDMISLFSPDKIPEFERIELDNKKAEVLSRLRYLCPFETGVPLSGQAFDELVKEGKIRMESRSVPDDRCMITGQREIFTVRVL